LRGQKTLIDSHEEGKSTVTSGDSEKRAAIAERLSGLAFLQPMRSRRLRSVLQGLLVVILLVFWAQALARNWDELAGYPWRVGWTWLLSSQALLLIQSLLLATLWWWGIELAGTSSTWRTGTSIWLTTQIARYLPGGVWDIAGRLVMGYQQGLSVRGMSASVALEMALQVLSASLFLLLVPLLRGTAAATTYLPLVVVVALGSLILVMPPVFSRIVNLGLRLMRRAPLEFRMTYRDTLMLLGARGLAHLLLGLGFVLFAHGVAAITWDQVPSLVAAYVGAWLVGYLAVFVPMGIGVREGVLVLLLQGMFPFGVISGIALAYRAWLLVRDLLALLLGLWLARQPGEVLRGPETGPGSTHG
jgi:hypothetical protein